MNNRFLRSSLTAPLFIALSLALFYGNAEKVHSRLLALGESFFGGNFQLQSDPTPPPDCEGELSSARHLSPALPQEEAPGLLQPRSRLVEEEVPSLAEG